MKMLLFFYHFISNIIYLLNFKENDYLCSKKFGGKKELKAEKKTDFAN